MEGEFQAVAVCFDGGEMSIKIASSLYRILPVFIIEVKSENFLYWL